MDVFWYTFEKMPPPETWILIKGPSLALGAPDYIYVAQYDDYHYPRREGYRLWIGTDMDSIEHTIASEAPTHWSYMHYDLDECLKMLEPDWHDVNEDLTWAIENVKWVIKDEFSEYALYDKSSPNDCIRTPDFHRILKIVR